MVQQPDDDIAAEYDILEQTLFPALEQDMAAHGYSVHVLGDAVERRLDASLDGGSEPPTVYGDPARDGFDMTWPQVYIADPAATEEDILEDDAFVGAIDVEYGLIALRGDAVSDQLTDVVVDWAEAWEDAIALDEVDDPVVADRTIDRGTVVLYQGGAIEDPM